METLAGGWTVLQRRGDFGQDRNYFLKGWEKYKNGFGNPEEVRKRWRKLGWKLLNLGSLDRTEILEQHNSHQGQSKTSLVPYNILF